MNKADTNAQQRKPLETQEAQPAGMAILPQNVVVGGEQTTAAAASSTIPSVEKSKSDFSSTSKVSSSPTGSDAASSRGDKRIKVPTPSDILLGRGKPFQNHSGNLHMRKLVDGYKDRYQTAHRSRKTVITEDILSRILESGGRFLRRQGPEHWVPVARDVAFEKVSHALRSRIGASRENKKEKKKKAEAAASHQAQLQKDANAASSSSGVSSHLVTSVVPAQPNGQHPQQRTSSAASSMTSLLPTTVSSVGEESIVDRSSNSSCVSDIWQNMAANANTNPAASPRSAAVTAAALGNLHPSALGGLLSELPGFTPNFAANQHGGGNGQLSTSQRAYQETLFAAQQQAELMAAVAAASQQQHLQRQQQEQQLLALALAARNNGAVAAAGHQLLAAPQQQMPNTAAAAQAMLLQQQQDLQRQQLFELLSKLPQHGQSVHNGIRPPPS